MRAAINQKRDNISSEKKMGEEREHSLDSVESHGDHSSASIEVTATRSDMLDLGRQ